MFEYFLGEQVNNPTQWFKFLNYDPADRKVCKKELRSLMNKTIENPEALSMEAFETVSEGNAVRQLTNLCSIKHNNDTGSFTCRAWMTVFTINEPVIQEYV